MLKQLSIKNLAIIDDLVIDFEQNLNVLTGETGAGKSIIIDAISLVFGARANNDMIANGKENAYISASLEVTSQLAKKIKEQFEIDVEEEFIITRVISSSSKGSIKINGIIFPLHVVNEIGKLLIDISSQNESQYLLNKKNHLTLLDNYIASEVINYKQYYEKLYEQYSEIKIKIEELTSHFLSDEEREYLKFKLNDLKSYEYTIEDEIALNEEYKTLTSLSKNFEMFDNLIDLLDNDAKGINSEFYHFIKLLNHVNQTKQINEYYEKFNSLYLDLSDLIENFKKDFSSVDFDPSRLDFLSNEITKINQMKRKYHVNDLLELKNKIEKQLNDDEQKEIILSKLNKKYKSLEEELLVEAKNISKIRKKYALKLSSMVQTELHDLYLNDAMFSVVFEECDISKNGIDDLSFYMSANKGVPIMPLIKVASGGEVSRIMLGLKSVFAKLYQTDIIIFDEIDTGVSGKVALAMGKKMEKIANYSQVLAITHLPQVAAMSDHHYYIYKVSDGEKTKTVVKPLDESQKISEVARLLSGDELSDSFVNAAKELISSK